tara:strand:- start:1416 stop:2030 length:615 start_codon:yes stop_codon:yes gene_type:complete
MANHFDFTAVTPAILNATQNVTLQLLNETTAGNVCSNAGVVDDAADFVLANDAEYINVLTEANNFYKFTASGTAAAPSQEPAVALALEHSNNFGDFSYRQSVGALLTDGDTALNATGVGVIDSEAELHNVLAALDVGYVYFDWDTFTVPADIKEAFAFLRVADKTAILNQTTHADFSDNVWTCASQDIANAIVLAYRNHVKKVK